MSYAYPFTEADMENAAAEWGCNCGPSALAFAIGIHLNAVRYAIPGFDAKRYTSPSMMREAVANLHHTIIVTRCTKGESLQSLLPVNGRSLIRIQWEGPWTEPGANPRWAYRKTHWIVGFRVATAPVVFDCNGGMRMFDSWVDNIVPLLIAMHPRATGKWFPTHIWKLSAAEGKAKP